MNELYRSRDVLDGIETKKNVKKLTSNSKKKRK